MIHKKWIRKNRNTTVALSLVFLFFLYKRVFSYKKPWNEYQDDVFDPEVQTGLSTEMIKAIKDPLQFFSYKSENPVISEHANTTYVMLWVPSQHIWSHVPLHLKTTLSRFPQHNIYSGTGATVGQFPVVDILSKLPLNVISNEPLLNGYRIQRYGTDNAWGWPTKQYWLDPEPLGELASLTIIKESWKIAPKDTQWFVFLDESSYLHSKGFDTLVRDFDPDQEIVFGNGKIISRGAIKALLNSKYEVTEGAGTVLNRTVGVRPLTAHNISMYGIDTKNWCKPPVLFTELAPWEIQSLYQHEKSNFSFYHDYILPYVEHTKANWVLYPSGPIYNGTISINSKAYNPHVALIDCKEVCEITEGCVAWQWRKDLSCGLELNEIRRGMAFNPKHADWSGSESQLYVSGYSIDRIRDIRSQSICDSLGNSNEILQNEGWFNIIKSLIKVQNSDILQAIKDFNA